MTDPDTSPPSTAISLAMRLLARSRYLIVIAVFSTLLAASALLVIGAVKTVTTLSRFFKGTLGGPTDTKGLILPFIELTDLFLLATVLYVIAIGLFELFVDDRLDLPDWLEIHDLHDLKEKLIGVLVVVMAVLFLGQVATWDGERNLLPYGGAIALVIAALTWFTSQKPKKGA